MDISNRLADALAPRYRLVREIGQGGMATVYLAEDVESGDFVAAKVMDTEISSLFDPVRFEREIRIVRALEHSAILPLLGSGSSDGLLYYLMPFVKDQSVRERLNTEGRLAIADALAIIRQVVEALDYAHAQGVVHRDIKPENILLDGKQAFLADFGIARLLERAGDEPVTTTGHMVGTAAYASPEQASGESRIDSRADIYSLGCVLFEMLSGEPPFLGRSPQAIIARHIVQPAPSLSVTRPDLPEPIVAAVNRALAKAPADRFSSAGAFLEALEAPRPVATAAEGRKRRIRIAVGAAVGAAVALVASMLIGGPPAVALEANKILVLPLASTGTVGDPLAGWDVALAIEAGLEHAEPLKFIDGWARLEEAQRADPASVTAEMAGALAADRGAAYYLDGVIRGTPDSIIVVVRLNDVAGDSLVAQETVSAAAEHASVGTLGMRALMALLPRLVDPDRVVKLDALVGRKPVATALFLQGERAYRQFRFEEALTFYRRAVAEDSLHVFAAIKGAAAADWENDYSDARQLVADALAHEELLPEKYKLFARGMDAFFAADVTAASDHLSAALAADPEWPEAATALAETYLHLLPTDASNSDSVAAYWLRSARKWDPTFAPPLYHLAEIAIRAGDLTAVATLLEEWRAFDPDTVFLRQIELSWECLEGDGSRFDWATHVADHARPVLMAGVSMAGRASQVPCAVGALEAIMDADLGIRSWGNMALLGLQGLALAHGDSGRADSLLSVALSKGLSFAQIYYAYDAVAGAPFEAQADSTERVIQEALDQGATWVQADYRWLVGLWRARKRDIAGVNALLSVEPEESNRALVVAHRALEAHSLVLAGGDTTAAIAILEGLAPAVTRDAVQVDWWQNLGMERLLLAELYAARGRHHEAIATAALLDHSAPLNYLPLLPRSLLIRLRSAEAVNQPTLAAEMRARLSALGWTDHELIPPAPR